MQKTDKKTITASQILLKTLQKLKVTDVFGYPGSTVLNVYDELSKQSVITHYLMQSEQSAVHAAEGYARVKRECGVVLVTAGPGVTNTVTGIANAYLDGYPLIVIAGDISSELAGKSSFQEINFVDIVKPCVKSVFKVLHPEEVESTVLQAYLIAMSGKKGPVVIDIPCDIFAKEADYNDLGIPADKAESVSDFDVSRAIEILKNAKSPVVVSGGGVVHSQADEELYELVHLLKIPVVSTMMGIGAFPYSDNLNAGMIGVYGHKNANKLIKNADALLVLGARFNDRVTSAFDINNLNSKTIIQVDINSKELIRNLSSDLAVNADIKMFLRALLAKISDTNICDFNYTYEDLVSVNVDFEDDSETLTAKNIAKLLNCYAKDMCVATDVGQHQITIIKNFGFNYTNQLLTSGGLGTMGFGFGAAIGASVALGKVPVVFFTGDGSFQMNLPELAVCRRYGIPVKIMVINNSELGMVRQLQDELYEGRHFETSLTNPDFVMLACSYGIQGEKVEELSGVKEAFDRAFSSNLPYLVEFKVRKGEAV